MYMTQSKRPSACAAASIGNSSSVTSCSPASNRTVIIAIPARWSSVIRSQSAASGS
jgi:hypothetical protein